MTYLTFILIKLYFEYNLCSLHNCKYSKYMYFIDMNIYGKNNHLGVDRKMSHLSSWLCMT